MKKKINGIISIPASLKGNFFRYWLEFLTPFHKLTPREKDIATSFIKHRYLLSKVIKDETILDKIAMGEETKRKVMQECNIAPSHFQIIIGKLRKAKFIVNNKINPKFIPKNIEEGDECFQLLLYFDLNAEDN